MKQTYLRSKHSLLQYEDSLEPYHPIQSKSFRISFTSCPIWRVESAIALDTSIWLGWVLEELYLIFRCP